MSVRIPAADYCAEETARIDQPASIGAGTKIGCFCHVMQGARIGKNCLLVRNVVVEPSAIIGDDVSIQDNVRVGSGVVLRDKVICGPSVAFASVVRPRTEFVRDDDLQPIHVGTGALLGANATIVGGRRIGEFAFVGAGAVVTRDVPPFAVVTGAPARMIGWKCRCGQGRLDPKGVGRASCLCCRRQYRFHSGVLSEQPRNELWPDRATA